MKVLIITASLDERSGWGRYSTAVIRGLQKLGHEVRVISENDPGQDNLSVIKIAPLTARIPLFSLLKNIWLSRRAAKIVDVVHALDGWPYGVYGFTAVMGTEKKLLINGVGTYSVAPLYSRGSSWLLRRAYARAIAIPCISSYTRDRIIAAGIDKDKVTTIHMGAPSLPAIVDNDLQRVRNELNISEQMFPIILTVGAIKERKGQLDTLKAVAILKQKFPDIVYIAAGAGNHKEYINMMRKYASEHDLSNNLRIVTNADDITLAALYSLATVFALNSNSDLKSHHFEGFGLVVLEAAGYGKPAVGSLDSGIEDSIDEGVTGFKTIQADAGDIAQKITKILERYEFFSANARIWRDNFTWEKTVKNYERVYQI